MPPSRSIRSGASGAIVRLPEDVGFDALLPQNLQPAAGAVDHQLFRRRHVVRRRHHADTARTGYEIRVNWLTGRIEIVSRAYRQQLRTARPASRSSRCWSRSRSWPCRSSAIGAVMATKRAGCEALEQHVALMQAAQTAIATGIPVASPNFARHASRASWTAPLAVEVAPLGADWNGADATAAWIPELVTLRVRAGFRRDRRIAHRPSVPKVPMMQRGERKAWRRAGFTLIETLVALALTGLVLSCARDHHRAMVAEPGIVASIVFSAAKCVGIALAADQQPISPPPNIVHANREQHKPLFDGSELSVTFVRTAIGPNAARGWMSCGSARPAIGTSSSRCARAPVRAATCGRLAFGAIALRDPVVLLRAP